MRKIISIILLCGMMLCFAACSSTQDGENDKTGSDKSSGIKISDISLSRPIWEGLMFAMQNNKYDATNGDYVWESFGYILKHFGYNTLYDTKQLVSEADFVKGKSEMTTQEASRLMAICFGDGATLPSGGSEKYFDMQGDKYVLKADVEFQRATVSQSGFKLSKDSKAVVIMALKENGKVAFEYNFTFKKANNDTDYPVQVVAVKENLFKQVQK